MRRETVCSAHPFSLTWHMSLLKLSIVVVECTETVRTVGRVMLGSKQWVIGTILWREYYRADPMMNSINENRGDEVESQC